MKKIENPPNPFHSDVRELLEPASEARLEVYEDSSRSILSKNDSPDLAFSWSLNPYRGCFHSCNYCYARQYHEYLDMGAGTDFESKIAVKKNAPDLLRKEFYRRSWKGEVIVFSGATDCYQPLEAVYKITQQCLAVCRDFRNPAAIITKSFLVTRDLDLLADLQKVAACSVSISIPFSSDDIARKMEPQASTITRRFQAVKMLAERGIPVGISLAPTIPGLNEKDIPIIMKRASDLGATFAFHSLLRLPGRVKDVFEERIKESLPPERVERIMNRLSETRENQVNPSAFGQRGRGEGVYWKSIRDAFRLYQTKYKLNQFPAAPVPSTFRVPTPQLELPLI